MDSIMSIVGDLMTLVQDILKAISGAVGGGH